MFASRERDRVQDATASRDVASILRVLQPDCTSGIVKRESSILSRT